VDDDEVLMKLTLVCCFLLSTVFQLLATETRVVEGYLVDQKCSSYYRETQPDKLPDHSRACVLACGREGGFGLIGADQYFPFDQEGRKLAEQWLENSSKEKDLRVKVTFALEGEKLKVLGIE
jgi:hypothetical protein